MSFIANDKIAYNLAINKFVKNNIPVIRLILKEKQLSVIKAEIGEPSLMKYIYLLIKDFTESFNIKGNMNNDQIIDTANNLMNDYFHFRLIDFSICFNKAKKGEYGKIYDRLDMQTIYDFVNVYDKQRLNEIYKYNNKYKEDQPFYERSSEQRVDINKDPEFKKVLADYMRTQSKKK